MKPMREAFLSIELMKLLLLVQSFTPADVESEDRLFPGAAHVRCIMDDIRNHLAGFDLREMCERIHLSKA